MSDQNPRSNKRTIRFSFRIPVLNHLQRKFVLISTIIFVVVLGGIHIYRISTSPGFNITQIIIAVIETVVFVCFLAILLRIQWFDND